MTLSSHLAGWVDPPPLTWGSGHMVRLAERGPELISSLSLHLSYCLYLLPSTFYFALVDNRGLFNSLFSTVRLWSSNEDVN